jgi:protein-L-isoaspartate(D-aspartate) O-methyltransferase
VRYVDIADSVHLRLDEGQQIDENPAAIGALLSSPREEAWIGVSLPPFTILGDLDLWPATRLSPQTHFLVLSAQRRPSNPASSLQPRPWDSLRPRGRSRR